MTFIQYVPRRVMPLLLMGAAALCLATGKIVAAEHKPDAHTFPANTWPQAAGPNESGWQRGATRPGSGA